MTLAAAAALLVVGCASGRASGDQLSRRAGFDLQCDAAGLAFVEIDDRTRGVRGCGRQATYVEECRPCANGYPACECTWIMNTDVAPQGDRG